MVNWTKEQDATLKQSKASQPKQIKKILENAFTVAQIRDRLTLICPSTDQTIQSDTDTINSKQSTRQTTSIRSSPRYDTTSLIPQTQTQALDQLPIIEETPLIKRTIKKLLAKKEIKKTLVSLKKGTVVQRQIISMPTQKQTKVTIGKLDIQKYQPKDFIAKKVDTPGKSEALKAKRVTKSGLRVVYTADTQSSSDSESDIDSPVKMQIFKTPVKKSRAVNLRITPTKNSDTNGNGKNVDVGGAPLSPQKLMTMHLSKKSGLQYKSPAKLLSKKRVTADVTAVEKKSIESTVKKVEQTPKEIKSKRRQSVTFDSEQLLSPKRKRVLKLDTPIVVDKIVKKRKVSMGKSVGIKGSESGQEWSGKEEDDKDVVVYRGFLAEVYHLVVDRVMGVFV